MTPDPSTPAAAESGPGSTDWAVSVARRNLELHRGDFTELADPLKVIFVDPGTVDQACAMHKETKRRDGSKLYDWGRVIPGDWDVGNPRFDHSSVFRVVYDRYVKKVSWEETGVIERQARYVESGGVVGGCTTRDQLVERYRRLDGVFEDIRKNGLRLAHWGEEGALHHPFVSIGRDGNLLHASSGRHRLAMAIVLELSTVPVYVLSRHWEWQRARDRVARGFRPEGTSQAGLFEHPDLGDLGR